MMFKSTLKYDVNLLSKHTLTKITSLDYNNTMYNIEREYYLLMNDNIDSCYNDTRWSYGAHINKLITSLIMNTK